MNFCPNCGSPVNGPAKFCSGCGYRLEQPAQEIPAYTPPAPQAPAYAPPAPQAPVYAPPVQEAPVYAPPVQEAPVYAPPVQEAPVYAPPVQEAPVYAPPVQEAPVYAPPVQEAPVYAPPVQEAPVYAPPVYEPSAQPVPGYAPQAPQQPAGKKKSKLLPIILIGVAVVAIVAVALIFILGGGSDASVLGRYNCTAMMGISVDVGDCWLELKDGGKAVFYMEGDSLDCTWSLNGETLTLTAEGDSITGVLKGNTLELDLKGVPLSFEKGASASPNNTPAGTSAPVISTQPPATQAPAVAMDYSHWEGGWYGWWVLTDAHGSYAEYVDYCWDVCAEINVYGEAGDICIWDPDYDYDDPLCFSELEFSEGWTDAGCFVSLSGYFMDAEVGYYDWYCDPYTCDVSSFDNLISFTGEYIDPEDPNSGYTYMIILRPWGMDWDDVLNGDTSGCPYEDMMPPTYYDWYLPLITADIAYPPKSFAEGEELLAEIYGNY